MTLREIKEGEAIYYIGELAITDGEVLIYTIDVTPSNDPSRYTVRFKKQFFVDAEVEPTPRAVRAAARRRGCEF